jgi:hypothetical protein
MLQFQTNDPRQIAWDPRTLIAQDSDFISGEYMGLGRKQAYATTQYIEFAPD